METTGPASLTVSFSSPEGYALTEAVAELVQGELVSFHVDHWEVTFTGAPRALAEVLARLNSRLE